MPKRNYKKLKKNLKKKLQKIKNYKISDNKLAALVFIVTAVLGARIGNYIRFFAYQKEKEQNDPYEPYSEYDGRPPDDEGKWDDDPRRGSGYVESTVSLFGKNRNKKIALASILGGTLGVGTGYYLRDKFYKKGKKNTKEMEERMKKDDEEFERLQKKLRESDAPESRIEEPRKKIEFEENFNQKLFDSMNIPFEDDEDFEIKSKIEFTGLEEEGDYFRAMRELNKSKKKLKEKKKNTKKEKRIFRNKGVKKRINSIKEQIKKNEQQAKELEEFYDNYFENKEKRLTKKDLIRILSRETEEDPNNLKYYSYWELYKMYEEIMEEQKIKEEYQNKVWELLNSEDKPVQEVMLFGKKKRKRRKKKRK